jgi:hypothetical protein
MSIKRNTRPTAITGRVISSERRTSILVFSRQNQRLTLLHKILTIISSAGMTYSEPLRLNWSDVDVVKCRLTRRTFDCRDCLTG